MFYALPAIMHSRVFPRVHFAVSVPRRLVSTHRFSLRCMSLNASECIHVCIIMAESLKRTTFNKFRKNATGPRFFQIRSALYRQDTAEAPSAKIRLRVAKKKSESRIDLSRGTLVSSWPLNNNFITKSLSFVNVDQFFLSRRVRLVG